jgi:hypothetical protein
MTKVNTFVVGAAKSGTTTVADFLAAHPEVFVSPVKEPNHFGSDIRIEEFSPAFKANTHLDEEDYFRNDELVPRQVAWIRNSENYKRLFQKGGSFIRRADCSTSYLYSENASEEIFSYNPNARIIIMLRNPITRAFSHYLMALKYGFTTLSFREAIEEDMRKSEKGWGKSELFLELGEYSEQIQRYMDYFPLEQLFIHLTEDLSTPFFYRELCAFLEVDYFELSKPEKSNTAGLSRYPKVNQWLTQNNLKKRLGQIIPQPFRNRIKKIYYTNVNLPTLNEVDGQYLAEYYADDIQRTAQLIDRDLQHWTNPKLWK